MPKMEFIDLAIEASNSEWSKLNNKFLKFYVGTTVSSRSIDKLAAKWLVRLLRANLISQYKNWIYCAQLIYTTCSYIPPNSSPDIYIQNSEVIHLHETLKINLNIEVSKIVPKFVAVKIFDFNKTYYDKLYYYTLLREGILVLSIRL